MSKDGSQSESFKKLFGRADEMFKRADKLFSDMPFYSSSTTTFKNSAPLNPSVEYKVVEVYRLSNSQGMDLEVELNKLGEDGWDLIHYDGGQAIFSRIAE